MWVWVVSGVRSRAGVRGWSHVGLLQHILQLVGLCPGQRSTHVAQVDGVVHHPLASLHHLQHRLPAGTREQLRLQLGLARTQPPHGVQDLGIIPSQRPRAPESPRTPHHPVSVPQKNRDWAQAPGGRFFPWGLPGAVSPPPVQWIQGDDIPDGLDDFSCQGLGAKEAKWDGGLWAQHPTSATSGT